MAAHRYWRVTIDTQQGGGICALRRMILRTTPGGPQAATGGTASAFSVFNNDYAGYGPIHAFNFSSTGWAAWSGPPGWIQYDFGAGNEKDIVEIAFTPRGDQGPAAGPTSGALLYSDDGINWSQLFLYEAGPYSNTNDIVTATINYVTAVDIKAEQARALAVHRVAAPSLDVFQGTAIGVYNVPAETMEATASLINVPYTRISQSMKATKAGLMAVVSGKVDNVRLRSWSFTLDGHDFYVLRLGTENKTLVYDLSTNEWSWWSSPESARWRPSVGLNWLTADRIPTDYGSNIVAGDDSTGILWVLDPEQGYDESMINASPVRFPRVATGQIGISSRQAMPVYNVNLAASAGYPSLTSNEVKLEYSDDQGHTYVTADQPMVSGADQYNQEFIWRSLGQVRNPGRLFRITDDGAFARLDYMSINE